MLSVIMLGVIMLNVMAPFVVIATLACHNILWSNSLTVYARKLLPQQNMFDC